MYSGETLTRAIISVFHILMRRLPLFLQRLPPFSPFSPLIQKTENIISDVTIHTYLNDISYKKYEQIYSEFRDT